MNILKLFGRKLQEEEKENALIGSEIKLRRSALSKTLDEICDRICSVSYLSKVENSDINPNPVLLEELCKRVHITKEGLQAIKNSKELFLDMLESLFFGDLKKIEETYNRVFDMKNYRAKIIKFGYALVNGNLRVAKRLFDELEQAVSAMQLTDLSILMYFEAWYYYQTNDFKNSFELLVNLYEQKLNLRYFDILVLELMLKILFKSNSRLYLGYAKDAKDLYISYYATNKLEGLLHQELLYFVKNKHINYVKRELLKTPFTFNDINQMIAVMENQELENFNHDYNFASYLYQYKFDIEAFKALDFDQINNLSQEEVLLLKAIQANTIESFHELSGLFREAMHLKDERVAFYVKRVYQNYLENNSRYKTSRDIENDYLNLVNEGEAYC